MENFIEKMALLANIQAEPNFFMTTQLPKLMENHMKCPKCGNVDCYMGLGTLDPSCPNPGCVHYDNRAKVNKTKMPPADAEKLFFTKFKKDPDSKFPRFKARVNNLYFDFESYAECIVEDIASQKRFLISCQGNDTVEILTRMNLSCNEDTSVKKVDYAMVIQRHHLLALWQEMQEKFGVA